MIDFMIGGVDIDRPHYAGACVSDIAAFRSASAAVGSEAIPDCWPLHRQGIIPLLRDLAVNVGREELVARTL